MYGNNRRFGGGREPPKPVSVGEELDVTIEAVGEKGDGVAKKNGFVLFVPGAKEGQRIKVKVTKVLRKVGFAEIVGEATSAPAEASSESSEEAAEEAPIEEAPEDSEDFGEEEPSEEAPEEPAEEAPEEEPSEEEPKTE